MSEHQDKQRAIQALENAGYRFDPLKTEVALVACDVYRHTDNLFGYSPNTAVVYADEPVVCMEVYVPASNVPAFLNPIAKERLESAAHDLAFKLLTTCKKGNTIHVDRVDKLVQEFVAGFHPEEAPTDANPTGGSHA